MQHQVREKLLFSYQRADEPFVRALSQRLQWGGFDVIPDFWDEKGVEPVPPELQAVLSQVNFFFYVLSPSAAESKWTRGAHCALLFQRMKQAGLRIVPLVRGAGPSPPLMAPLRHIDFRGFNPADPAAFRTDQAGPFQELMALLGRKHQKGGGELIPPGMATYEFTLQPRASKPKNLDRSLNYELIIRNVKKDPLRNFALTVRFRQPVLDVKYDKYRSSSGELSTGEGLSPDGTRFNWIGDSLYGGGGFALFNIRSKEPPQISRISTKFVGRVAGTNRVIAPDPEGV